MVKFKKKSIVAIAMSIMMAFSLCACDKKDNDKDDDKEQERSDCGRLLGEHGQEQRGHGQPGNERAARKQRVQGEQKEERGKKFLPVAHDSDGLDADGMEEKEDGSGRGDGRCGRHATEKEEEKKTDANMERQIRHMGERRIVGPGESGVEAVGELPDGTGMDRKAGKEIDGVRRSHPDVRDRRVLLDHGEVVEQERRVDQRREREREQSRGDEDESRPANDRNGTPSIRPTGRGCIRLIVGDVLRRSVLLAPRVLRGRRAQREKPRR